MWPCIFQNFFLLHRKRDEQFTMNSNENWCYGWDLENVIWRKYHTNICSRRFFLLFIDMVTESTSADFSGC